MKGTTSYRYMKVRQFLNTLMQYIESDASFLCANYKEGNEIVKVSNSRQIESISNSLYAAKKHKHRK